MSDSRADASRSVSRSVLIALSIKVKVPTRLVLVRLNTPAKRLKLNLTTAVDNPELVTSDRSSCGDYQSVKEKEIATRLNIGSQEEEGSG